MSEKHGLRTDGGDASDVDERMQSQRKAEKVARKHDPARRMRRAVKQIRREGRKVALIYAVVDAAFVTLLVNLLLQVARPESIPATFPWPRVVFPYVRDALGAPPEPLSSAIVLGVGLGLLTFVVEFVVRSRRPFVEQFERANPGVREALRTARDTVRANGSSRMAMQLYEDVLEELRKSSSLGLVNTKRVFLVILLVMGLSFASIQVAVVDLDLRDLGGDDTGVDADRSDEYEGLQDANSVLGEPEDVSAGDTDLNATIQTQGGGDDGTGTGSAPAAYDTTGFAGSGNVEGQQAGFAEQERLEDAELIRDYNLRIRTEDDDE